VVVHYLGTTEIGTVERTTSPVIARRGWACA